jgi:hypothetical protein
MCAGMSDVPAILESVGMTSKVARCDIALADEHPPDGNCIPTSAIGDGVAYRV